MDLFFMSSEIRKRIETRVGLFFKSSGMRSELNLAGLFHKQLFSSHPRTCNKTGNFLKIGDLATLWYNGKS